MTPTTPTVSVTNYHYNIISTPTEEFSYTNDTNRMAAACQGGSQQTLVWVNDKIIFYEAGICFEGE